MRSASGLPAGLLLACTVSWMACSPAAPAPRAGGAGPPAADETNEAPSPSQLARAALACPARKGDLIGTSCAAAAAFLAPGVLGTPDGRRELFHLVLSENSRGRALAAWGYVEATKEAPLTIEELTAVLVVFGREARLLVVEALAQSIRRTVLRDPDGAAGALLVSFLDDPGSLPIEDGGPNSRDELLLGYDPAGRRVMGAVLFRSEIEWTRAIGRAAVLASDESVPAKCAIVASDLARNGDAARGLLDQISLGCTDDPAPTVTRLVDVARGAVVDDADVRGWPFEPFLPLCESSPKLRAAIGAGLHEVAQPLGAIAVEIRLRALDDLAQCDPERARATARGLQRDRLPPVARRARALLAPSPASKRGL